MRARGAFTLLVCATLSQGCDPSPGPEDCYDVCGPGTRCESRTCVVDAVPDDEPAPTPPAAKKRRGRKGKRSRAEQPSAAPGFTPEDDSNVPEYQANASRTLDMKAGTERLGDRVVNQHLARAESKFNGCIATAAQHYDGTLSGDLDFTISIAPTGKVAGVSVKGSKSLREGGVVPCVRKVVYGLRFPSFDGQTMGVDYSFKVN